IAVGNIPALRTDMRSHRQRLLNILATPRTLLGGEARIDSDDLTTSTCSLVYQDCQKRAPRGVQNALCQSAPRQATDSQVFDDDGVVCIRIPLRRLEVKVSALALNFQMGLCRAARHLTAAVAPGSAGAQAPLLAAQGRLAGPKETRVLDRLSLAVG